jgi:hypothetical protein
MQKSGSKISFGRDHLGYVRCGCEDDIKMCLRATESEDAN